MQGLETIATWIVVAAAVALVARELACWYFKINEHVRLQKSLLEELRAIHQVLDPAYVPPAPVTPKRLAAPHPQAED